MPQGSRRVKRRLLNPQSKYSLDLVSDCRIDKVLCTKMVYSCTVSTPFNHIEIRSCYPSTNNSGGCVIEHAICTYLHVECSNAGHYSLVEVSKTIQGCTLRLQIRTNISIVG